MGILHKKTNVIGSRDLDHGTIGAIVIEFREDNVSGPSKAQWPHSKNTAKQNILIDLKHNGFNCMINDIFCRSRFVQYLTFCKIMFLLTNG